MILFHQDWRKFPNCIIDTDSRNASFIELAYKLKSMKIVNSNFMLQLHDPRLQGVDPFSSSLTLEQMAMIAVECRRNSWYYFREIARAPANAGSNPAQITANRANISLWWSFYNHITYVLTQPRQTGKSFSTDLLMTSLMNFQCTNTQINLLTKDDTLRAANIKRLKEIYEELPAYLNFKTRNDANNTETVTINRFNNTYLTHVPQSSVKGAYKVGRGLTSPIFQIDEGPFQPNIEIAMGSALGAMGAACESAELQGEPYGVILTTTAGKKDDPSGKYIYQYTQDAAAWTEHFYDAKDIDDLRKMVCANSRKGTYRIYGSFTHRQLGKSDAWLKEQLDRTSQSPDDANRDFFNIWTSGTESSPLSVDILERLTKSITPESYQQIHPIGGYVLRWYLHENAIDNYLRTKKMIIGIDTSDASGGDDISFVGTDVETGGTVCVGTFNETNLIMFAQWLVSILENWENATMVIERRSSAVTIIDYLLMMLPQKGIDPFQRLFNWVVNEPYEYKELYKEVCLPMRKRTDDLYIRAKKYFGFATSGGGQTSRSELYSTTLINACKRCAALVKDRAMTEQITGLIIKNGRVDHPDGGHDDLVIGFLMSHWFLTMAKNLIHYGIDSRSILIEHKAKVEISAKNAYSVYEQQKLREQIQETVERMAREDDAFVLQRLEKDLRYYDTRLVLEDGEIFSVDSVMSDLSQQRKTMKNRQINSYTNNYYSNG